MWPSALYFLLGVTVAPLVKPLIKEVLRQGVTAGIVISEEVQKIVSDARENYEDIVAEASAAKNAGGGNTNTTKS
jgi:acyl-CoA synthetase (NDP forming)